MIGLHLAGEYSFEDGLWRFDADADVEYGLWRFDEQFCRSAFQKKISEDLVAEKWFPRIWLVAEKWF